MMNSNDHSDQNGVYKPKSLNLKHSNRPTNTNRTNHKYSNNQKHHNNFISNN